MRLRKSIFIYFVASIMIHLWQIFSSSRLPYCKFHLFLVPTGDLSLPPTNLVTSEVTPLSFRVSWTAPTESVDRYRVEYYPARGGTPQEVRCGDRLFYFLFWGGGLFLLSLDS